MGLPKGRVWLVQVSCCNPVLRKNLRPQIPRLVLYPLRDRMATVFAKISPDALGGLTSGSSDS